MQLTLLLYYVLDDDDDDDEHSPRWAMLFPTVSDQYETNYVSPASTRFQPDIQSLASSALLFPTPPWQYGYINMLQGTNDILFFSTKPESLAQSQAQIPKFIRDVSALATHLSFRPLSKGQFT